MSSDSKTDIWMPLSIGDYLADTAHLSTIEHGAYLLLLMHYWRKGPLPNDTGKIAQIAKLSPDAWSIAQALLAEFFTLEEDGMYHQKRADAEKAKWQGKKQKAQEKAHIAAEARWKNHATSNAPSIPTSNAQAMLDSCPLSLPSSLPSLETKATPKAKPSTFEIPDWVSPETWADFEETRKKIRAPMTNAARRGIISDLQALKEQGNDPEAVLRSSISNSWRGVFPIKAKGSVTPMPPIPKPKTQYELDREAQLSERRQAQIAAGVQ